MRVGFVQNNPVFGDIESNLARMRTLTEGIQAELLVLPELFQTGYQFTHRDEAEQYAERFPEGPGCRFVLELARSMNGHVIAGLAERDGDAFYNSALIAGPEGIIGTYRKAHLFDTELEVFSPGALPLQVFDMGSARVGVMICFDWRFPETARTLALKGADIIAHPSNLVLTHCPDAMITRCLENRVYAITADRVGREERIAGQPLKFMGQSQVVDPDGNIVHRASLEDEEAQVVDIDIEKARNKSINGRNNLFQDRRVDLYQSS